MKAKGLAMFKLNTSVFLLMVCVFGLSLRASATPPPPTYSVSIGGGSFNPSSICNSVTATASLTGSLNFQSNSTEVIENGDSWAWSASVTGYEPNSQAGFGAVPSGIIPPSVSATSGSATSKVTATAD